MACRVKVLLQLMEQLFRSRDDAVDTPQGWSTPSLGMLREFFKVRVVANNFAEIFLKEWRATCRMHEEKPNPNPMNSEP